MTDNLTATTESEQLVAFARLVKNMRSLQREYFRTRDSVTLRQCKALESQVDRQCAEIELYTKGSLFDLIDRGGVSHVRA